MPRLKPIHTFALVRTNYGHTLIFRRVLYLIDETNGFPNVCLVMFWVIGLFVTYQSAEVNEALPPLNSLPYPGATSNQMTATSGEHRLDQTVIATWDTAMKKIVRQDKGLSIADSSRLIPCRSKERSDWYSYSRSDEKRPAVISLPKAQTRSRAYGIDARKTHRHRRLTATTQDLLVCP